MYQKQRRKTDQTDIDLPTGEISVFSECAEDDAEDRDRDDDRKDHCKDDADDQTDCRKDAADFRFSGQDAAEPEELFDLAFGDRRKDDAEKVDIGDAGKRKTEDAEDQDRRGKKKRKVKPAPEKTFLEKKESLDLAESFFHGVNRTS